MADESPNPTGSKDPATGRFLPGNTANPGGRPRSLARLIDAKSKDGGSEEIIEFMFSVMRGDLALAEHSASQSKSSHGTSHKVQKRNVPLRERRFAAEWLGDHRFGKAPQPITGAEGEGPVRVEVLGLLERLKKLVPEDEGQK